MLVTPLIRRLALHVNILDQIDERRMHESPKPRIGGIAIYIGFTFALFAVMGFALSKGSFVTQVDVVRSLIGLLFGSTLIFVVGLWDDIMGMRPRNKFLAQIVVALISMLYGFLIPGTENPFHHGDYISFPLWVSVPLTLVWYLGMINAINFIDGLDGLLTGYAAISGAWLFAIALGHGHLIVALIVISLVGAALGFLPYNFNPAKIFLGDSGALLIGYIFATMSIMGVSKTAFTISIILPAIVLALPILDTAFAIVRRTLAGKKITEADRGHFHHLLVLRFGLDVKQAVLLIYGLCFVLGALAFVLSGGTHSIHFAWFS